MIKAAFCHVCGGKLRRGYPGNDPENGPARMQCKAGCATLNEEIEHSVLSGEWDDLISERLTNAAEMEPFPRAAHSESEET